MIEIIYIIDIIIDFLIIDAINADFNDVKNVNSINDENIVTNANNNYFYCINDVKNFKDINDIFDLLAMIDFLIIDDAKSGFNDVNNANSIIDKNIVTNTNNSYFYWVNNVKNFKDINDIFDFPIIDDDILVSMMSRM